MKLDKDPFLANMNVVKFEGNKVLVRPSQTESTKGKEVITGEEQPPKKIKPNNPKDGQWQNNERNKPQQRPKASFYILMAMYMEGRVVIRECKTRTIRNPKVDSSISLS
jgi:hypothetical protein